MEVWRGTGGRGARDMEGEVISGARSAWRFALEAVLPYAQQAAIEVEADTAHDEWEGVAEATFTSSVILPLCDTSGRWSPDQFQRLGVDRADDRLHAIRAECQGSCFVLARALSPTPATAPCRSGRARGRSRPG